MGKYSKEEKFSQYSTFYSSGAIIRMDEATGRIVYVANQIPNGNRACYLCIFQCQNCGYKNISLIDFLKVRAHEILKGGEIYPYEEFKYFIENNTTAEE